MMIMILAAAAEVRHIPLPAEAAMVAAEEAFKKKTGKTPNSYRNDVLSTKEVSGNEG